MKRTKIALVSLQNNFLTLQACERECPVFINPCPTSSMPTNVLPRQCSANNRNACGLGQWCHIGATAEQTVCCPNGEVFLLKVHTKPSYNPFACDFSMRFRKCSLINSRLALSWSFFNDSLFKEANSKVVSTFE